MGKAYSRKLEFGDKYEKTVGAGRKERRKDGWMYRWSKSGFKDWLQQLKNVQTKFAFFCSKFRMVQATPKVHAGEAVMGFIDKFYEHTPGFQV